MRINLLILFVFILFLVNYLYLSNNTIPENLEIIENMENANNDKFQEYNFGGDTNLQAMNLAIQNSGNISFLNSRIKKLQGLLDRFTTLENQVKINSKGIAALSKQISNFSGSLHSS